MASTSGEAPSTQVIEEGGQLRSSISRKGGYSYYYAHADDHKRKDGQRSYGGEPEKLETQTVKEKARQKVTAVSSYYWEDKGKTVKVVVELESNGLELSSVQAKDVAVVHNEDANTITLDLSTTDGAKALRLGPLKLAKDIKADEAPRVKVTDKRVILRVTKVNADEKWYDLVKK